MPLCTRTAERLSAISNKSTSGIVRSDELDAVKDKYEKFVTQFQPFIETLKIYHASLVALEHNRSEVLQQVELFTKGTPLYDKSGKGNTVVKAAPTWAISYGKRDTSYCSMERQMSALNHEYAEQVEKYCIEYVREWEIVVTTRITSSLKQAYELKKVLEHYDTKVEKLLEAEAKVTAKGNTLNQRAKDKLTRNQNKQDLAKQEFDKYATGVCNMIDAAVDSSWMDMTPLIYRLTNMERDRLGGEEHGETFTKSLSGLVEQLVEFSREHDIELSLPEETAKKAPLSASKIQSPAKKKATASTTSSTTTTATTTKTAPAKTASNSSSKNNKNKTVQKLENPPKKATTTTSTTTKPKPPPAAATTKTTTAAKPKPAAKPKAAATTAKPKVAAAAAKPKQ